MNLGSHIEETVAFVLFEMRLMATFYVREL